jgi:cobalt-zinc-cadmium efflux system outer membrane protein
MKPLATGALLSAALLLVGCAPHRYQAAPVAPATLAAGLYARSLDDPALRSWMEQNGGAQVSSWPLRTWDLDSLTLAAFYFSPDLDVARANVASAEAASKTAAAKPNPAVSIGPGYQGPSGSQFITSFDFSLPIETAGKRGYRIADAAHLSTASRLQLGQTAWAVRSRVRATLMDYLFAVKAAELLRSEAVVRGEYVRLTEARYHTGEVPLPDLTTARIDLTSLRQTLSTAEGSVQIARSAVAAAIGVCDSAIADKTLVSEGADNPPAPSSLPPTAIRKLALQNRLDIRRALEQYEAAQAALQLEIARQYPDLNLGPAYNYEEGTNFIALGLSSVLPLRNRNEGPIAEAEAQRKVAGAQVLAVQSTIVADIDRSQSQYSAAFKGLENATAAIRELKEQQQSAVRQLQAGETEQLTVIAAELQTSVSERAHLEALHQTQLALGMVEDALQRPLGPTGAPALPRNGPRN